MESATLTPFGKEIKKRLIDIERNQSWLIDRVKEETGLYFDRSYMHKIMTGKVSSPKIVRAIMEIINLPDQDNCENFENQANDGTRAVH